MNVAVWMWISVLFSCGGLDDGGKRSVSEELLPLTGKLPLPENGFSNAYADLDGTMWFCSNGGGVFHLDGESFMHYTVKDGLSSDQVFSVISDHHNNLWFGTQNGLTKYDRKELEQIPLPFKDTSGVWLDQVYPTISPNAVHSLAADDLGNLWIGTAGGGAYRYDGKEFRSFLAETGRKQEDSLYHNWIPYIEKDNNGYLWFASMTYGGVTCYDGTEFRHFLIEDGLTDNQVRTIYCDRSGNIWIGFNGNRNSGLTMYDGTSFKSYYVEDGLCNKRIRAIFEDREGTIWLGTGLGNVCVFDGQQFSEFNYEGKTFSDVLFIIGDQEDNIWFGGKYGIWKYDGEILTEIATNE